MTNDLHIILAAGSGTRLRPLTDHCPKAMVPLLDKPLIEYQLETIAAQKPRDILLVTGFLHEKFACYNIEQCYNPEYAQTNMVYSLNCAKRWLENRDNIIISYGDIVYSQSLYQQLIACQNNITVVVDTDWATYWQQRFDNPLSDAETLKLNANGIITEIGKKPHTMQEIEAQYIGLMKFSGQGALLLRQTLDILEQTLSQKQFRQMYMTDLLQYLIQQKNNLSALPIKRNWFEVDDMHDLKVAEAHFEETIG